MSGRKRGVAAVGGCSEPLPRRLAWWRGAGSRPSWDTCAASSLTGSAGEGK